MKEPEDEDIWEAFERVLGELEKKEGEIRMNDTLPATINFDNPRMIATLKQTVAQGATDEEFQMFAELCKASGLNPFKKEVWFIKAGGRAQIMTGINGFLAIANRHPAFDGMAVDYEYDVKGELVSATCKVYRKDRTHPSVGKALLKEFKQNSPVWNTKPHVMLGKVAKSIALREAFPQEMNGLYTQEEMPENYQVPEQVRKPVIVEVVNKETGEVSPADWDSYKYIIDPPPVSEELRTKQTKMLFNAGFVPNPHDGYWYGNTIHAKLEPHIITDIVRGGKAFDNDPLPNFEEKPNV